VSTDALPEVLTVQEAAALLRINRKTIYLMVEKKQLPWARRFRGAIRIHRATLLAWLSSDQAATRAQRGRST